MRGPAQGVESSIGHVTLTFEGAGAVPSEATSTLMSLGSCRVVDSDPVCSNSSSQRSLSIGLRPAAASEVGVTVGAWSAVCTAPSPSTVTEV